MRKVIVYISMSLDGYIATEDDNLSFLDIANGSGHDFGYTEFTSQVDTYIVGRKTYEVVKGLLKGEFPQAKQYDCYIITRGEARKEDGVTFYNGDLSELITSIRQKPGKNIYCDGGGQVIEALREADLIDEYIITIMPVMLGKGKQLFLPVEVENNLQLLDSKQFEGGFVQVHYRVNRG